MDKINVAIHALLVWLKRYMGATKTTRIFISYRRNESSGYSRLLCDRLRDAIPNADVFMDVEGIQLGEDWRTALTEHLDVADVVLVLIGREWLTMTDDQGQRRLDDPQDVTRWEVKEALVRDKRVVPVLLEGVPPLDKESLPEPLASLADMQATAIQHETFEAGLETLIAQVTGAGLRDRLRFERGLRRISQAKQWSIPVIAVAVFLLAWIGILDFFTLDTRTTTWTLALADVIAPPALEANIALVAIPDSVDPRQEGTRAVYGKLVEKLVAAGASAIVFDLYFHQPRSSDGALARAFRNAVAAGTHVFFGFTELTGNRPRTVPLLAETASGVGLACVGRRLGYAVAMPIAFNIESAGPLREALVSELPSLALLGYRGPVVVEAVDKISSPHRLRTRGSSNDDVLFSMFDPVRQAQSGCKALMPQTTTAALLLRLSPIENLRAKDRRVLLHEVLADQVPSSMFEGRTVIVGFETKQDEFTVAVGLKLERRYGYELYADAINTLATKRIARPLGPFGQIVVMVVLAAAGAWIAVVLRNRSSFLRRSIVGVSIVGYAVFAVTLAALGDVLLHTTYGVVAFFTAYLTLQRLSRKWLA